MGGDSCLSEVPGSAPNLVHYFRCLCAGIAVAMGSGCRPAWEMQLLNVTGREAHSEVKRPG